jgi:hypothetical protein
MINMPLLEWIGLVSFILLLWAIICIMPSVVAFIAFHLANVLLLGDIVVPAIAMALSPRGVVIVVTPMAIMVVAISPVMLVPIATIIVVVVSSTLVVTRTPTATMEASLMHRLLVLAGMMLSLPIFRLLHLALKSYSLIQQGLKGRSVSNRQRD